jgi:hypothetical protein
MAGESIIGYTGETPAMALTLAMAGESIIGYTGETPAMASLPWSE